MPSRDFTAAKQASTAEPVSFTIDGDTFLCVPPAQVPAGTIMDLAELAEFGDPAKAAALTGQEAISVLHKGTDFLDSVMYPESRAVFAARLRDGARPISLEQMQEVIAWLAQEVYFGRPLATQPSSSPSSPEATLAALVGTPGPPGAASTDGAPPEG